MYTQKDDGTGLRQLTNKDLVTYSLGRPQLSPLELELTLRLEEIMTQREDWVARLPTMPCGRCPVLTHAFPQAPDVIAELGGDTTWA